MIEIQKSEKLLTIKKSHNLKMKKKYLEKDIYLHKKDKKLLRI